MSKPLRTPSPVRSLSARLLLLTIGFVLLGEILIYVPSISRFRKVYIEERIAAGHLATLSLEASATGRVDRDLEGELLNHAGVIAVTLHAPRANLMLGRLPAVERVFDLRAATPWTLIADGELHVSSLYRWNLKAFGGSERAIIQHLMAYAEPDLAMSLQNFDRLHGDHFDWRLNDAIR